MLAKSPKTHNLEMEDNLYELNQVNAVHATHPRYTVILRVQGRQVLFEVDSGCSYTLVSEETYQKLWSKNPPRLKQDEVNLRM